MWRSGVVRCSVQWLGCGLQKPVPVTFGIHTWCGVCLCVGGGVGGSRWQVVAAGRVANGHATRLHSRSATHNAHVSWSGNQARSMWAVPQDPIQSPSFPVLSQSQPSPHYKPRWSPAGQQASAPSPHRLQLPAATHPQLIMPACDHGSGRTAAPPQHTAPSPTPQHPTPPPTAPSHPLPPTRHPCPPPSGLAVGHTL